MRYRGWIQGTLACTYPLALWVALSVWNTRGVALVTLTFLSALFLTQGRRTDSPWSVGGRYLPLLLVAPLLAWVTRNEGFIKMLPALSNLLLLLAFANTLRHGSTPMLAIFARWIEKQDLSTAQERHCRTFTWVWCGYFLVNAGVSIAAAFWAARWLWALHTSLIAYIGAGLVFAVEYAFRRVAKGANPLRPVRSSEPSTSSAEGRP